MKSCMNVKSNDTIAMFFLRNANVQQVRAKQRKFHLLVELVTQWT